MAATMENLQAVECYVKQVKSQYLIYGLQFLYYHQFS
ncbi:unnamed protein product [Brassica oleracea var. botrytis]|nr:unnamed protein product [Brassica napus]VDD37144.1 unnamed protein product [Brassica oleracea]